MRYSEFEESLDVDISWRKKEISDLYLLAKDGEKEVLLKSLILLLYAHWEGFIKKSSKLYLKYVSDKNIHLDALEVNFQALALKDNFKRLKSSEDAFSVEQEIYFIERYQKTKRKFKLNISLEDNRENSVINTEHNLKESILKRIFRIVGIHYKACLQTKGIYIDTRLLANRNSIAHGDIFTPNVEDEFSLSLEDINKLKMVILTIMDSFKEDLLEYAAKEFYLSEKAPQRLAYEVLKEDQLSKSFTHIGA